MLCIYYVVLAMIKVTGTLQKSSEIMKLSSALIRLPQISQAMREMSMEMMKVSLTTKLLFIVQTQTWLIRPA